MIRSFSIGDPETALLHVTAVIDPISEQAQKWSSLLQVRGLVREDDARLTRRHCDTSITLLCPSTSSHSRSCRNSRSSDSTASLCLTKRSSTSMGGLV